jgi:hypothetical protein
MAVVDGENRPRGNRRIRRMRRWAKHTPNSLIALNLIAIGALLAVATVVLAMTIL